jgi:phosphatidate cytidylyltransferase
MFVQRLLTAIVLLCVFVGALLFLSAPYWAAFLLPGLLVASFEWGRLAGYGRWPSVLFAVFTMLSSLSLLGAALWGGMGIAERALVSPASVYVAAAVFWLVVVPVWLVAGWRTRHPLAVGIAGWLVLVPTWVALVEMQAQPTQLLFVLGVVWIADSAAYLTGRRFGHHRLAPAISPGKTWEGAAGAIIAVAVYYALAGVGDISRSAVWSGSSGWIAVLLVAIMSVEGDLFESWMKRLAGVKDSGNLLPGHGGVLDRIDGLTASLPVAALLADMFPAAMTG